MGWELRVWAGAGAGLDGLDVAAAEHQARAPERRTDLYLAGTGAEFGVKLRGWQPGAAITDASQVEVKVLQARKQRGAEKWKKHRMTVGDLRRGKVPRLAAAAVADHHVRREMSVPPGADPAAWMWLRCAKTRTQVRKGATALTVEQTDCVVALAGGGRTVAASASGATEAGAFLTWSDGHGAGAPALPTTATIATAELFRTSRRCGKTLATAASTAAPHTATARTVAFEGGDPKDLYALAARVLGLQGRAGDAAGDWDLATLEGRLGAAGLVGGYPAFVHQAAARLAGDAGTDADAGGAAALA